MKLGAHRQAQLANGRSSRDDQLSLLASRVLLFDPIIGLAQALFKRRICRYFGRQHPGAFRDHTSGGA